MEDVAKWSIDDMVEVTLKEDDDFLKVKETLTRIGIASRREKKLYQSCHILHKQGKYYIVHFCPHDLFTNTKADLGTCGKIHDDALKVSRNCLFDVNTLGSI